MTPSQRREHAKLMKELLQIKNSSAWARNDPAANKRIADLREQISTLTESRSSARERIDGRAATPQAEEPGILKTT